MNLNGVAGKAGASAARSKDLDCLAFVVFIPNEENLPFGSQQLIRLAFVSKRRQGLVPLP